MLPLNTTDPFAVAQVGVEPTAFGILSPDGRPIAYRAESPPRRAVGGRPDAAPEVEAAGLEPAFSCFRSRRALQLPHISISPRPPSIRLPPRGVTGFSVGMPGIEPGFPCAPRTYVGRYTTSRIQCAQPDLNRRFRVGNAAGYPYIMGAYEPAHYKRSAIVQTSESRGARTLTTRVRAGNAAANTLDSSDRNRAAGTRTLIPARPTAGPSSSASDSGARRT